MVHLQGVAAGGGLNKVIFQLPPGFRPGPGKIVVEPAVCTGCGGNPTGDLVILGTGTPLPNGDGAVVLSGATIAGVDGVTFRAEA